MKDDKALKGKINAKGIQISITSNSRQLKMTQEVIPLL